MASPELTPEAHEAMRAWSFCEGWHPERIAYAAAWLHCDDVDRLTYLLLAIRDRVNAWQAAQRAARGKA